MCDSGPRLGLLPTGAEGVYGQNKVGYKGCPERPGHLAAVVPHLPIRLADHIPALQIASIFTLPQGEIISAREVN